MAAMAANETDWLALEGAANARVVVAGALLRSDNLQALSPRDVRLLVDEHALELVIDLRTDVEVAREGPGPLLAEETVRVEHRSLYPDAGPDTDLLGDTVLPWGLDAAPQDEGETRVVRSYLSYIRRRPDSIAEAVRAIARSHGAVLVHCAAGKDRTGVLVALALDAAGVDRAVIAADYMASDERVEAILERLLASDTYHRSLAGSSARDHATQAGAIERVLELVDERHGGARALLDADLQLLRTRLGGP
jgi:hypothetical protein